MSATVAVLDALQRTGSAPTPPPPPATMAETGLHPDTLAQLMLKTLVAGESSGTQLADSLRLPYTVLDALIQHARVEKLVEVRGTSGAGSAGYRYTLTDLGRDRAMQFFDISRYVGAAPVPRPFDPDSDGVDDLAYLGGVPIGRATGSFGAHGV